MTDGKIPRQLGAILDVLGLDPNSLFGEDNKNAGQNRDRVVGWLYRILDTLDNKTGHLLRFTALLLAAQTFLAGILVRDSQDPTRDLACCSVSSRCPVRSASCGSSRVLGEVEVLRQGARGTRSPAK